METPQYASRMERRAAQAPVAPLVETRVSRRLSLSRCTEPVEVKPEVKSTPPVILHEAAKSAPPVILRQARRAQSAEPRAQRCLRNRRVRFTVGTALAMSLGTLSAWAVWSDGFNLTTTAFAVNTVAFGAGPAAPIAQTDYSIRPGNVTTPARAALRPTGLDTRGATNAKNNTDMSVNGDPVIINIPGTVVAEVLNQAVLNPPDDPIDAPPFIWSFTVAGMSPTSVGLQYTMEVLGQGNAGDGSSNTGSWTGTNNQPGYGNIDTLLAYSTLQIYPGAQSNDGTGPDCSQFPPMPDGSANPDGSLTDNFGTYKAPNYDAATGQLAVPNVYIYQNVADAGVFPNPIGQETVISTPMVISQPGYAECPDGAAGTCDLQANAPANYLPSTQVWCAALKFINVPDQLYSQTAWVIGTGDDTNPYSALQNWGALVAFPPSLPALGYYLNTFTAMGDGCAAAIAPIGNPVNPLGAYCTDWNSQGDLVQANDTEVWWAMLYPDPANEPDVVIQLTPQVININPSYSTPNAIQPISSGG